MYAGVSVDMWRPSKPSHGRKGRTSITNASHQSRRSSPASELNSSAISTSLALHAISTDFFDESPRSSDLTASCKARKEAHVSTSTSASYATEPTRLAGTIDKNAHSSKKDFDMNLEKDLGLVPESGSNVVDGILRIRGTYYAKEYVTVICKLGT